MLSGMASNWKKWLIILFITMSPHGISAQDVEAKLAQRAEFTPSAGSVQEQLIQVAQHYKIPMGIEWVIQPEKEHVKPIAGSTVMTLLSSILQSAPNYSITVRNGVVNVSDSRYTRDSRNFLNLLIGEFSQNKANVFGASAELRFKIHRVLHPERFVGGSTQGYGYGVPDEHGLDIGNISFSAKDATVRDILDRIVAANGNTLWLVNIAPSRMMKTAPFFAQFDADQEGSFFWTIIPLGNLSGVISQENSEEEITRLILILGDQKLRESDPDRIIKAIQRLGELKATVAVDDLVGLLTFKQTFKWERDDGIVHEIQPITPGNRYPAVSALFQIGKPALPALVSVIERNEPHSPESSNAVYAVLAIFRENLPQGVKYLRKAAAKSFTSLMAQRLLTAAEHIDGLAKKLERSN